VGVRLTLTSEGGETFQLRWASCWPQAVGHSCRASNLRAAPEVRWRATGFRWSPINAPRVRDDLLRWVT